MKKLVLLAIILLTSGVNFAQALADSCTEVSASNIRMAQYDDNLFLCNWLTDQTFAYSQASPDTAGGLAIELCKSGEKFCLPKHGTLWSVFKKSHKGLDIDLKTGDSVFCMFDGVVRYAQYNKGGFGNLIIIRHYNGLETYYAHLSKMKMKSGDKVTAGDLVGLGGSTGRSKSPHLHLEVRYKDNPIDPFSFIDWDNKVLKTNVLVLEKKVFTPWETQTTYHYSVVSNTNTTDLHDHENDGTIPTVTEPIPADAVYYTVKRGDTLYSIARKYGTTVNKICSLSNISNPDKISAGQKIRVK